MVEMFILEFIQYFKLFILSCDNGGIKKGERKLLKHYRGLLCPDGLYCEIVPKKALSHSSVHSSI